MYVYDNCGQLIFFDTGPLVHRSNLHDKLVCTIVVRWYFYDDAAHILFVTWHSATHLAVWNTIWFGGENVVIRKSIHTNLNLMPQITKTTGDVGMIHAMIIVCRVSCPELHWWFWIDLEGLLWHGDSLGWVKVKKAAWLLQVPYDASECKELLSEPKMTLNLIHNISWMMMMLLIFMLITSKCIPVRGYFF